MNTINPNKPLQPNFVEQTSVKPKYPKQSQNVDAKNKPLQPKQTAGSSASLSSIMAEATDGDASEAHRASQSQQRAKGNTADGHDTSGDVAARGSVPQAVLSADAGSSGNKDFSQDSIAAVVEESSQVNTAAPPGRHTNRQPDSAVTQDDWMMVTATMQPSEVASDAASRAFESLVSTLTKRSFSANSDAVKNVMTSQLNSVVTSR